MVTPLRIATRGSKLALWQAEFVRKRLSQADAERPVELVRIVSTGDAVRDRPLFEVGGVGVFTKEVQEAILDGRADLAVHSLKDLPTVSHPQLCLAAVPERGAVGDVLLAPQFRTLDRLPEGAQVATSSLRRRAQLLRHRPDLRIVDIRGNVETRIARLHKRRLDGLILATAGVERLGLAAEITERLGLDIMLPAVGQGALGVECRCDDIQVRTLLQALEHLPTRQAVVAERAFLRVLEGGCQVPIGAFARPEGDDLSLRGIVLDRSGKRWFSGELQGSADDAEELGNELAASLLHQGAGEVLGRS